MLYKSLMAQFCLRFQVEIWAYCLMPNHVHLIAVPSRDDSLRLAIGGAHTRYSAAINKRHKWSGHLWQGRFFSYPMDDHHLLSAARYIERNPVVKGLVDRPEEYLWSSAKAHLNGACDHLLDPSPLVDMTGDWQAFISLDLNNEEIEEMRLHQRTGRPLGTEEFILGLEKDAGRSLRPKKMGRPRIEADFGEEKVVTVPGFPEASLF